MKKRYLIPILLSATLVHALMAMGMFGFGVTGWLVCAACLLLIAANVIFWLKSGSKRPLKIVLSVVSGVVIVAAWLGVCCNPYWGSVNFSSSEPTKSYDTVLTFEQAEADMEEMLRWISKDHPAFIDGVPAEVSGAYEAAIDRLAQEDEITVNELRREMQRTLSVMGDGHTCVYSQYGDTLYLKTVPARQAEGWKFHSINGMTPEQLFDERRDLFCYEADSWGILTLRGNLNTVSGLDFLGIDTEGVEFTWINEAGETVTDTHTSADFLPLDEYVEYNAAYQSEGSEQQESFVWYEIDEDSDLAVLTLTACQYNEEYKACLRDMFDEVRSNGISNVAVDLRGNGGGNSLVVNEFIRYLDADSYAVDGCIHRLGPVALDFSEVKEIENEKYADLTFDGEVYLLTDSGSFSSAMMFAEYIKDNRLGTIIGEPPGNDPNGYGDTAVFRLSNSGLFMSVSTKRFFRPDRECTDKLVMPDIECEGEKAMDVLLETISVQ